MVTLQQKKTTCKAGTLTMCLRVDSYKTMTDVQKLAKKNKS